MTAREQTRSTRRTKNEYYLNDGTWVPGVTTILGMRGKSESLVNWSFRIGQEFPNLRNLDDYVSDLATIGSCAHDMLDAIIRGKTADLNDFTPNEVSAAANAVRKYDEWAKGKSLEVIASDLPLVSHKHRFGGKLDLYVYIDGVPTVMDFKTGKHIWPSHLVQCVAYAELIRENVEAGMDFPVPQAVRVLQIGRTPEEGFGEQERRFWTARWKYFLALRDAYEYEKWMDKE